MDDEFEDEGWELDDELAPPTGLTFAAFLWNVLTLFADIFVAFSKLCFSMRADVAVHHAIKSESKTFAGSVEAGIESLG